MFRILFLGFLSLYLPLFVPAKSSGKTDARSEGRGRLRTMPRKEEENKRSAVSLSFRLSSPAVEGLTLLRAPNRGFASEPAPALTLLVPPPPTAQTSGRNFLVPFSGQVFAPRQRSNRVRLCTRLKKTFFNFYSPYLKSRNSRVDLISAKG